MNSTIKTRIIEYVDTLNDDDLVRLLTVLRMFFAREPKESSTEKQMTIDNFGRYHLSLPDKIDRSELYGDRVK